VKKFLDYESMTSLIDKQLPKIKEEGYDEVVAIVRGGLTAAHYIAKELRLPVGVYFPSNEERGCVLHKAKSGSRKLLFVEDLVAQGRTFEELFYFLSDSNVNHPNIDSWDFFPILVDHNDTHVFKYFGMKTSDWIVFPYEKYDKMDEGDRGLFRMQTDTYGE